MKDGKGASFSPGRVVSLNPHCMSMGLLATLGHCVCKY